MVYIRVVTYLLTIYTITSWDIQVKKHKTIGKVAFIFVGKIIGNKKMELENYNWQIILLNTAIIFYITFQHPDTQIRRHMWKRT